MSLTIDDISSYMTDILENLKNLSDDELAEFETDNDLMVRQIRDEWIRRNRIGAL